MIPPKTLNRLTAGILLAASAGANASAVLEEITVTSRKAEEIY
jgi:hypothetical protein